MTVELRRSGNQAVHKKNLSKAESMPFNSGSNLTTEDGTTPSSGLGLATSMISLTKTMSDPSQASGSFNKRVMYVPHIAVDLTKVEDPLGINADHALENQEASM